MRPNRAGAAEALPDNAGFYDHAARTIAVQPSLRGSQCGHSTAAAPRSEMMRWGSPRPTPADMACKQRRGEDLCHEQLRPPLPAFVETAEPGVKLAPLGHGAGEAQPSRGLRPTDGTAWS
jgi:hypothetical protein